MSSSSKVMRQLFPTEKFEFLTLVEPHKAYQGSVAVLRRMDPDKQPRKYRLLWGGKDEDDDQFTTFTNWGEALDRPGLKV